MLNFALGICVGLFVSSIMYLLANGESDDN